MMRADFEDFVARYKSDRKAARAETERLMRFPLDTLLARDKVNLDIFWLKDDTLDDEGYDRSCATTSAPVS